MRNNPSPAIQGFSRTQRENIFAQATFKREVWQKVQIAMDMFEGGSLKDQKLKKSKSNSVPEFKQHLLQPMHHLNTNFQEETLDRIIAGELSLKELKDKCIRFRASEAVKTSFVRLTNVRSWKEAQEKYPAYTTESRLAQFTSLDFRHSTPDMFKAYCQSAIDSSSTVEGSVKVVSGVHVAGISGDFLTLSAQSIKDVEPTFSGATLIICKTTEVNIGYTKLKCSVKVSLAPKA